MRALLLVAVFLAVMASPAHASPVVADLSTYRISIDAGFSGIRVFIFGARNETGDVVVVIRGPQKNFIIRKKERVMGVWTNRRQLVFPEVPDFYVVASSRPLSELNADLLLRQLKIGSSTLLTPPQRAYARALFPEFSEAFLKFQQSRRLYAESLPLGFMGETLFKTVIPFPDTIPRGDYTAEIYLISDGELTGMQSIPIHVQKTGMDAAIYDLAHRYPPLYGLLAISLALMAGWLAGRLFDKA